MPRHKSVGLLFFLASLQFVIMLIVAETQYPGYNAGENYISDLGTWDHDSAFVFNSSIIIFGTMVLAGSWLMYREWQLRTVVIMFALSAVGAIGVGVFNESIPAPHYVFAFMAFLFGNLGVIAMGRHLAQPLSALSYGLGATGLVALALYGMGWYLGLGPGGMERMICYPIFGWMMAFGGATMASRDVVT